MSLLDNIFWHTLTGPHAKYSAGTADARRYAKGFSPILGFANPERPNLDGLAAYCELDEHFYCADWAGKAPSGWRVEAETSMFRMRWDSPLPAGEDELRAVLLSPAHAQQALDLAMMTRPGPFGPRTIELGDYYGCFAGEQLIAMAGERMRAQGLREISGVCTHPAFQGHGLARRLVAKLIHRQVRRGETPFLHVMRDNAAAHGLYLRMGFSDDHEGVVRVIARI